MWWRRGRGGAVSGFPGAADRERARSYRSDSSGDRNEGSGLPLNVRLRLASRETLTLAGALRDERQCLLGLGVTAL